MADSQDINEWKTVRIKLIRDRLDLNQTEFGARIDVRQSNIAQMEAGTRSVGPKIEKKIISEYGINPRWWAFGDGEMFQNKKPEQSSGLKIVRTFESNAEELPYPPDAEYEKTSDGADGVTFADLGDGNYLMTMPVVDQYAFAGYLAGYSDVEYLEELPKYSMIVGKEHSGLYRAFRIRGDSMNDGTIDSIPDGTVVACRQVERHLYERNTLHLRSWQHFVIVHTEGIVAKEITRHDPIEGKIYCHSLNPDKESYPDFTIRMENVLEIYNIVEKRIQARR